MDTVEAIHLVLISDSRCAKHTTDSSEILSLKQWFEASANFATTYLTQNAQMFDISANESIDHRTHNPNEPRLFENEHSRGS